MNNQKTIQIPKEIQDYLWGRYLPETTYKIYVMIGYLQSEKIVGDQATNLLFKLNVTTENQLDKVIEEKKKVVEKLGYKYPTNRKEDLELLLHYQLIKIGKDEKENIIYLHNTPVPKPEEVLSLDQEEMKILENIKFEMNHQNAFDMILTLLLNNNGNLVATIDHIHKTTKVKFTDIKKTLEYLVAEGSISIQANKPIDKLKKEDKVYININKEVFEQKRFVI
ncbi:DUF6042 family protein [Anaerophilus nitritogenes]|uniref:DUF6042 family protein n=1 Tax=Anaerophilus nitritogenes TaxID=2498136 RepID=UPI00101D909A|nr:DUF6042 family protein [Anaerophilus nitritogenes]